MSNRLAHESTRPPGLLAGGFTNREDCCCATSWQWSEWNNDCDNCELATFQAKKEYDDTVFEIGYNGVSWLVF